MSNYSPLFDAVQQIEWLAALLSGDQHENVGRVQRSTAEI